MNNNLYIEIYSKDKEGYYFYFKVLNVIDSIRLLFNKSG